VARALVEVRRVTVDELGDVLELWTQGRDEITRQGRQSTSAEQVAPRLADALAAGQIEILLARREGRPAGFLILREMPLTFMVDQPAICIDQLFVAAEARRHGVARAMLSLVAGRAERSGAEQIVSSVTPWARDTHRFFARLGFSPLTVRRSVSPATLRRRLTGESTRGGLEDLLARRRSLRARARRQPALAIVSPDLPLDGENHVGDGSARLA
jgi:GNAT superfamily N-acetyltransferase